MILAIEILLLVMGLYMLITGKTWDKRAKGLKSGHFRALGGFMISFWIVAIGAVTIITAVYFVTHQNTSQAQFEKDTKILFTAVEIGLAIVWAIIAHFWHNSIIKRLLAARPSMQTTPATCPACQCSLTGLPKGNCPNCGTPFDPATFSSQPGSGLQSTAFKLKSPKT